MFRGPLPPTGAARLIAQLARGLAPLHDRGDAHGAIFPSSVALAGPLASLRSPATCRPRPEDGSSLAADLRDAGYVAPELLPGQPPTPRSDVWALGALLYESITGEPLFADAPASTVAEVLAHGRLRDPTPLQERAPWVSSSLASLAHGALLRPAARCPDAGALARALEATLRGDMLLRPDDLAPLETALRLRRMPTATLPASWADCAETGAGDALVGSVLGGYRLLRLLGRGGMGAVYEAQGEGPRRALKVIRPELLARNPQASRRFLREARALASIQSDHVVQVFHADTQAGAPFLVMELLDGEDLASLLTRAGPLAPQAAARLFTQAARGLQAAHRVGLIHRDIKPANLFLHRSPGGDVTVKVCDFGIVKRLDSLDGRASADLTRTGGIAGSPAYMSPEQARDPRSIDARSDVWSLCISLHEALSGRHPWADCASVGELLRALGALDPPPLGEAVPAGLAAVVRRGLARARADRWPSMDALIEALGPWA